MSRQMKWGCFTMLQTQHETTLFKTINPLGTADIKAIEKKKTFHTASKSIRQETQTPVSVNLHLV